MVNAPGIDSCARCSGSLVPPPNRDDRPLPPVTPLTRRAELLRQADRADSVPAADASSESVDAPDAGLYVMARETTGQPHPPVGAS
ncbi:MAG TPA: hypothetical protein VED59_00050 [Acidimicrobiales bacterium]|nr:hypothetical protein [Acidimicrobiales bacterium]